MVVPGANQYWIQCFDLSCSFLTSHKQFIDNWDMMEYFLSLDPTSKMELENVSLNRILVDRQQLGLMPTSSIILHMQSDFEKEVEKKQMEMDSYLTLKKPQQMNFSDNNYDEK